VQIPAKDPNVVSEIIDDIIRNKSGRSETYQDLVGKYPAGNVISENDSILWNEFCAMRTLFPTLYAQNPDMTFEEFKKWKESASIEQLHVAGFLTQTDL
jgi:hypothetical protein